MLPQVPRGTKDILPEEILSWQALENKARQIFSLYNYAEIRTPLLENITLFKRSLGNETEIVQKQMFVFQQGDDQLVLRPEATAAIARAYLENNLGFGTKLTKLYYIGPMFRAERPQKGRFRQFHHIGIEAIGSTNPMLDAEIIDLADQLLNGFGISGYTFMVNSLGCHEDKLKFNQLIKEALLKHKKDLCEDCQIRFEKNVFRILDCKNEQCKKIVQALTFGHSYLCPDCKKHFDTVIETLKAFKINFVIKEHLVRGLDYYSGTVFEITHPNLGAQDALGAGGRYDYLFKELADKEIGAVGFALGQERLLLAIADKNPAAKKPLDVYCICLGEAASKQGIELVRFLRKESIQCDYDFSDGSLKSKMKEADRLGASFALIIGDNELVQRKAMVKSMKESKQEEVSFEHLVDYFKKLL